MCDGQPVTGNSSSHSCACSGHSAVQVGKTVDAATELIFPAIPFPSRRVIEIAGEEKLRQVVRRHHVLLTETSLVGMFPMDAQVFAELVEKVADFVVEACGGPAAYSKGQGSTCMRTRHFPFTIDESAREIWLAALFKAMAETDFPMIVREEYWTWLEAFSVRMINRRTMKAQPIRVPYAVAELRFGQAGEGLPCGVGIRCCPRG